MFTNRLSLFTSTLLGALFVLLGLFAFAWGANAATYYYVGATDAFTTAASWHSLDNTACGAGDGAVPGAADTIIFTDNCTTSVTIPASTTVTAFTMQNSYTGIVQATTSLTITGATTIGTTGVFDANGAALTLGGNLTVGTAVFTDGGNTTTFNGTGTQAVNMGGTNANHDLNNVVISTTGAGVVATAAATKISGTLTISNDGELDTSDDTITVTGTFSNVNGGTWRLDGDETVTLTAGMDTDSGTVEYNDATGTTGLALGNTYSSLTFDGGGTWVLNAALDVNSSLNITAGDTLNSATGPQNINIGKDLTVAGAYISGGTTQTVTFDGTGAQTIITGHDGTADDVDKDYNNVVVSNSADIVTLSTNPLEIDGTLTISHANAQLDLANQNLAVVGAVSNIGTLLLDGGNTIALTAGNDTDSGTVTYNGAGANDLDLGDAYYNLSLAGTGTVTLDAALDVNGDLSVSSTQTLDVSAAGCAAASCAIDVVEDWTVAAGATFTARTGTVTFSGTGTLTPGNEAFSSVTKATTGTTTLGAALDVDDTLTISAGTLSVSGSNFGINVKSWVDAGAGVFTAGTGTVTFDVSGGSINANQAFNNLTINHAVAGTTTIATNNLDVDGTLTLTTGTLDSNSLDVTVKSWADAGAGVFTAGTRTVTVDVSGGSINANQAFNNLTISTDTDLAAALDVDGTLTISNNALYDLDVTASNYAINVKSWTDTGAGTFTEQGGTVTFDVAVGVINSNEAFENVTISSSDVDLGADMVVDGTVTISAGADLDVSALNYAISARSWTDSGNGTFNARAGTVTFNVVTGTINSNSAFNNVTINNGGSTTTLSGNNLDVDDTLTISAGTLASNGLDITAKSWTDAGAGLFTQGTRTVTFDVAGGTINSNSAFYNVTVSHAGTTTVATNDLNVDGSFTISSTATVDTSTGPRNVAVGVNLTIAALATFTTGLNTVTFDGSGAQIITSGLSAIAADAGNDFNNVTVSNTAAAVTVATNPLEIDGNLTIDAAGELDLADQAMTLTGTLSTANTGVLALAGSQAVTIGTMDTDTGSVNYTGSGTYTQLAAGDNYYDLALNGTGSITLDATLDINGDLSVTSTQTFATGAQAITIADDWTVASTATFNSGTGTVTFNGAAAQSLNSGGGDTSHDFYNLTTSGAGTDLQLTTSALMIANDVTIGAGTTWDDNGINTTVKRHWTNSGTYTAEGTSVVSFDGTVAQTIITGSSAANDDDFNRITINNSSATVTVSTNRLEIDTTLTVNASNVLDIDGNALVVGTLDSTGTLALNGDETVTITSMDTDTGTVLYNGTSVTAASLAAGNAYNDLTFSGTGSTWTMNAALDVNDDITLTAGTLASANFGVTVGGDWLDNGGAFTEGTGTVTFDGTGSITSNGESFYDLTLNSSGTVTVADTMDVDDDVTFTLGILSAGSNTITVGGDWVDTTAASFTEGTGTVTFDGSTAGGTINTNDNFENLIINDTGNTITLGAAMDVDAQVVITLGTLDVSASNYGITVGGGWTDNGAGAFTERSGTVTFDGSGTLSSNEAFNDVAFNGGTVTLGANLDVDDDLGIGTAGTLTASTYTITLGGDWTRTGSGTFNANTSTVDLDGASAQTMAGSTTFYGLTKTETASTTLYVTAGDTMTVSNTLTLTGTTGALITFESTSAGTVGIISAPASNVTVTHITVRDIQNTGTTINCSTSCINRGNNPGWNITVEASSSGGGGGGGGGGGATSSVALTAPNGGEAYAFGQKVPIKWSLTGTSGKSVGLFYSTDGGSQYTKIVDGLDTDDVSYTWTVPSILSLKAKVKVVSYNSSNREVASDESARTFTIQSGSASTEDEGSVVDESDSTPDTGAQEDESFDGVEMRQSDGELITLTPGGLFRGETLSSVYYVDVDGKRAVFPNEDVFNSYGFSFNNVVTVDDDQLQKLALGRRLRMNAGSLIKIQSDNKVYEVGSDGLLHHVPDEATAKALYGSAWAKLIKDVNVVFWGDYSFGDALASEG